MPLMGQVPRKWLLPEANTGHVLAKLFLFLSRHITRLLFAASRAVKTEFSLEIVSRQAGALSRFDLWHWPCPTLAILVPWVEEDGATGWKFP